MEELPAQHIQRSSKAYLNKWEHIGAISMRNAPLTPEGVFDRGWQAPPIRHTHTHMSFMVDGGLQWFPGS